MNFVQTLNLGLLRAFNLCMQTLKKENTVIFIVENLLKKNTPKLALSFRLFNYFFIFTVGFLSSSAGGHRCPAGSTRLEYLAHILVSHFSLLNYSLSH